MLKVGLGKVWLVEGPRGRWARRGWWGVVVLSVPVAVLIRVDNIIRAAPGHVGLQGHVTPRHPRLCPDLRLRRFGLQHLDDVDVVHSIERTGCLRQLLDPLERTLLVALWTAA